MTQVLTKTSTQFGTVRQITDNGVTLYCANDVAKALGYAKPNNAVIQHCRATLKRGTPISGKMQEINYIPEADVYRLMTHSKMPKAVEFEKWIFEDVVPAAVRGEQLTLPERKPYEYFDKTYNGEPVMSETDISELTGKASWVINRNLRKHLKNGIDYYYLTAETLAAYKRENPRVERTAAHVIIVTRSGFAKLIKLLGLDVETPKLFLEAKQPPAKAAPKPTEKPKEEYAIVLDNLVIQQRIERIRKELVTVDVLLDKYNRHNIAVADMNALRNTLDTGGHGAWRGYIGYCERKIQNNNELQVVT